MTPQPGTLSSMEYPGRLIAIGGASAGDRTVIIYGITGRSPSSQARKLAAREGGIWVQPTDEEVLQKGRVDLLVYPAVLFGAHGIAVSNGRQTEDIFAVLSREGGPVPSLAGALERWDYEPDAPIFTPRIGGCVMPGNAALGLVRKGPDGVTWRSYFEVTLLAGKARLVSTYQGPNRDPLPSFEGEPWEIALGGESPRETAEAVYEALRPRPPGKDLRVAVACVFSSLDDPGRYEVHIINRQERT
jgi:IMP cyclohydrolase